MPPATCTASVTIMPLIQPAGEPAAGGPTHADLTVRVDLGREDLAGELLIDGRQVSTFTGWLGLLTALDRALDTLRPAGPESGAVQAPWANPAPTAGDDRHASGPDVTRTDDPSH